MARSDDVNKLFSIFYNFQVHEDSGKFSLGVNKCEAMSGSPWYSRQVTRYHAGQLQILSEEQPMTLKARQYYTSFYIHLHVHMLWADSRILYYNSHKLVKFLDIIFNEE